MAVACECLTASSFDVAGKGLISVNFRAGTNYSMAGTTVLKGATIGDLAISAYTKAGYNLSCAGRAGTSYQWIQKISCDSEIGVYFIPGGTAKAYKEGEVASEITMTSIGCDYTTFSASASSGPHTPIFKFNHSDGYDLKYTGAPISVSPKRGKEATDIGFLSSIIGGGKFYMTSFSWQHQPPSMPVVNYSFIFQYDCNDN